MARDARRVGRRVVVIGVLSGAVICVGGVSSSCGFTVSGDNAATTDAAGASPADAASVLLDAGLQADSSTDAASGSARVTDGLVALYTFRETAGAIVHDVSGVKPALDLTIATQGNVRWGPDGLTILDPGTNITSGTPASKLAACTNAFAFEAWVAPSPASQGGPARIVSHATDGLEWNAFLGMGHDDGTPDDNYLLRLATSNNNRFAVQADAGLAGPLRRHVVALARVGGDARIVVDRVTRVTSALPGVLNPAWGAAPLSIGSESNETNRRWLGTLSLVAVYCRALSASEIATNFAAGHRPQ